MQIINIESNLYPKNLKQITNPPKIIYAEGNVELLNTKIISIIGSRVCSEKGKEITKKFVKKLVKKDITIASGLAKRNRHSSTYSNTRKQRKNNSSIRKRIK